MYRDECSISDAVLKNIRCYYPGNIKGSCMNGFFLQFLRLYLPAQSTCFFPAHRSEMAMDICIIVYLIDFFDVMMETVRIVAAVQFVEVTRVGIACKAHSVLPDESDDAVFRMRDCAGGRFHGHTAEVECGLTIEYNIRLHDSDLSDVSVFNFDMGVTEFTFLTGAEAFRHGFLCPFPLCQCAEHPVCLLVGDGQPGISMH